MNSLKQHGAAAGWFSGLRMSAAVGGAKGAKGAESAVNQSTQKQDLVPKIILILPKL